MGARKTQRRRNPWYVDESEGVRLRKRRKASSWCCCGMVSVSLYASSNNKLGLEWLKSAFRASQLGNAHAGANCQSFPKRTFRSIEKIGITQLSNTLATGDLKCTGWHRLHLMTGVGVILRLPACDEFRWRQIVARNLVVSRESVSIEPFVLRHRLWQFHFYIYTFT